MPSTRIHAAAPGRSRVFALSLLSLAVIALGGSALAAAGSSLMRTAAVDSVVRVSLNGYGNVTVTVEGAGAPYTCTNEINADQSDDGGCKVSVPVGTTLTFRATPKNVEGPEIGDPGPNPPVASEFRGWSRPECPSRGACTVKVAAAEEWVVAQFSPVWLEAIVEGPAGTIEAGDVEITCEEFACQQIVVGLFEAEKPVTVTARSASGGATTWGFGCAAHKSDLAAGRCVVTMSMDRNFVGVAFDGFDPPTQPPYNKVVSFSVELAGTGKGKVEGSGESAVRFDEPWSIACGGACFVGRLQAQTEMRLVATEEAGSNFERWTGPPCGAEDTCDFTVGKYPKAVATFTKVVAPKAVLIRVTATGRRATRAVVTRLSVNGSARANLRLLRKGRVQARKSYDLAAGRHALPLRVPRSVKPGWSALALEVVWADGTRVTFRNRWVKIGG